MDSKIKVKHFNDLPFEERGKILYYSLTDQIQCLDIVLHRFKNDLSPNAVSKIKGYRDRLAESRDSEYEEVD